MASYNRTIMTGRVTMEPESYETTKGVAVLKFSLAVDNVVKKGKEKTCEFIPHEVYGRLAEAMKEHLHKGMLVQTEGSLHSGSYVKDGTKRKVWKIVACWIGFQAWPKGGGVEDKDYAPQEFDPGVGEEIMDDVPF